MTDAISRSNKVRFIPMHHEQAAGFAAIAESQLTGSPSVALVSTGCASTNLLTPLLCAWQDSVPAIFISGQNFLRETIRFTKLPSRTLGQQEADIISIVDPISKLAVMIDDSSQIATSMEELWQKATTGRKGPVWLDVPLDIQSSNFVSETLESVGKVDFESPESDLDPEITKALVNEVSFQLNKCKRPIFLIGSGVFWSKSGTIVRELSEKFAIPIAYASSAPDVIDGDCRYLIGSVGALGGSRLANFAIQQSDLIIVLGHRLSSNTTGEPAIEFAPKAKKIVIDIDPAEHIKNEAIIDLVVPMDVKKFLSELWGVHKGIHHGEWCKKIESWKVLFKKHEILGKAPLNQEQGVDLYYLSSILPQVLDDEGILVTDSGLTEIIVPNNTRFARGQRCLHPTSQGSMGYALPAAIGASFSTASPVTVVVGDGSLMMNLQELQTISHFNLNVRIIVVCNGEYSIIRKRQLELFRGRTIGTDRTNGVTIPPLEKVAQCFNMQYLRIRTSSELNLHILALKKIIGPALIELDSLHFQDYTKQGYRKSSGGRLIKRSLEDMEPFLDWAEFESEVKMLERE